MSVEAKRSKPFVRPATREDCLELAPRLREEDVQECLHSSGLPARESLLLSFHGGETFAVVWGTEVVALFGHVGVPRIIGVPWMLASPTLSQIRKSFLRECREYVQRMLSLYGTLENYVWVENKVHIKWLQWLGFEFGPAQPYGINGQLFYRFFMKEDACVVSHLRH